MTNKIKSLIYLSCFILASVVYNISIETETSKEMVNNDVQQEADMVINTYSDQNEIIHTK